MSGIAGLAASLIAGCPIICNLGPPSLEFAELPSAPCASCHFNPEIPELSADAPVLKEVPPSVRRLTWNMTVLLNFEFEL